MNREESSKVAIGRRKKRGALRRAPISAQELRSRGSFPQPRPRFKAVPVLRPARCIANKAGIRSVSQRSEHTGHIFQRRQLRATARDWTRRLAFEIYHDIIRFDLKHLTETIIAVNPDALTEGPVCRRVSHRQAEAVQNLSAQTEHQSGRLDEIV